MAMKLPKDKFMSTVKVGEKGQIVIPKEVREMFDIEPGDLLMLLADRERGIAIVDNEGYAVGATFAGLYRNTLVSFKYDGGSKTMVDVEAGEAKVIDLRDDFTAPYDREINSLDRLNDAYNDGKNTVTMTLYMNDQIQVIFVTGVETTKSNDASCTVELASEVATIGGNATSGYTMAVSAAEETATLTITPAAKAIVKSVESSATGNVTVEGSGNSWTLTAKANGESTITVKVQAEDGSQKDTTFKVTVSGIA